LRTELRDVLGKAPWSWHVTCYFMKYFAVYFPAIDIKWR